MSTWIDLGPCGCCGGYPYYYPYSGYGYYGYYPYYFGGGGGGSPTGIIPITCCDILLPTTLIVTIATSGNCSLPASMAIVWDPVLMQWSGEISTGGSGDCGTFSVTMTADCKVTIVYGANEGPDGFGVFVSLSCNPFMLTYTRSASSPLNNSPCCSGGITITITV